MGHHYVPCDKVGAEVCYLLYSRNLLGGRGPLIGAYRGADEVLAAIGTAWPGQKSERLYAVYQNGNMREVTQTAELMKLIRETTVA